MSTQPATHLTGPYASATMVPDTATAFLVAMIRAPIVGGHHIDGGNGKTG